MEKLSNKEIEEFMGYTIEEVEKISKFFKIKICNRKDLEKLLDTLEDFCQYYEAAGFDIGDSKENLFKFMGI